MPKFIKIGELIKLLNSSKESKKKISSHNLRFWEKQFKQIKPKKINNQRYYSSKQIDILKLIIFLLKEKRLTISGVKNELNSNNYKLDDYNSLSLKADYYRFNLKKKSKKILYKLKRLKKYGKKDTY
tara:strand:- start:49 stop:429 length:381 start_codon:yes stop_codon:yes gene_type:complete